MHRDLGGCKFESLVAETVKIYGNLMEITKIRAWKGSTLMRGLVGQLFCYGFSATLVFNKPLVLTESWVLWGFS